VAGFQHIQIDPDMGFEKALFIKGGFSRGLNADE
jgi:hypothetical protein